MSEQGLKDGVEGRRGLVSCCAFNIQFVVGVKFLGSSRTLPLPFAPESVCRQWELDGRWKHEWEYLPIPSELKSLA